MMRTSSTLDSARGTTLHAAVAGAMYVSPFLLFVPAAYISAGLRHGWRGIAGAIGGSLLVVLVILAILGGAANERLALAARLIAEVAVPSVVAWWMLERGAQFGSVLLATVIAAAAGLSIVEMGMQSIVGFSPVGAVVSDFRQVAASSLETYRNDGWQPATLRAMERSAEAIAGRFIPSLLVSVQAIGLVLSMAMLVRLPMRDQLRADYRFRFLALPEWTPALFAVAGLAALGPEPFRSIGWSTLVVVALLHAMQGAAVVRWLMAKLRFGPLATAVSFVLLLLFAINGIGLMMLFLLGLFDPFFDFRKLNRKEATDESHPD